MRTIKITVIVTLLFGQNVFGQLSRSDSAYLKIVSLFYYDVFKDKPATLNECYKIFDKGDVLENEEFLFEEACSKRNIDESLCAANFKKHLNVQDQPSLFFTKLKEQSENLTQGLPQNEIYKIINSSSIISYDNHPNSQFVNLILNKRHVYFLIGKYDSNSHLIIDNIYLEDGQSIYNKVYPDKQNYLKVTGKIIDKDGFTNIRSQANINSPIIGEIKSGEEIWYTPNDNSSWWMVESKTNSVLKGFVFFNRIAKNIPK